MKAKHFFVAAPLALAGCTGIQSPINPSGEQALWTNELFMVAAWICGLMYLAVMFFLGWSVWNGRHKLAEVPNIQPADRGLGWALWVWAAVIMAGLLVLAVGSFLVERALSAVRVREALQVRVTGHQWWWRIEYRDRQTGKWIETANELHLPAGRTARIALGSSDVIHSFWVPNVAGKMDVIPGRTNIIDVSPHRVGWFRGQCAEFCGLQHAHMAFDVKVDEQPDFDAWLRRQAQPAPAKAGVGGSVGGDIFATKCGLCHSVRGTAANGRVGPDLTHIGARRAIAAGTLAMSRGALQGWIASPQSLKPGTLMPAVALEPDEADAVSKYLLSLK